MDIVGRREGKPDVMLERIAEIEERGARMIAASQTSEELESARIELMGRRSELGSILRGIGDLDPSERGAVGREANQARERLEQLLVERREELEERELTEGLTSERVDVTLPGTPPVAVGHQHLISRTRREIEDIFVGLGYRVLEGPEIEHDHYNFTALNHPPGHPARMLQDTFYIDPASLPEGALGHGGLPPGPRDVLLRTHTSPMQVRAMEAEGPPIFVVVPGKVYRRDSDATHTPMFHQVEGLAVGEGITLADLQGTLAEFGTRMFGGRREARLRPHFFPFTEPSVEVDISCFRCDASGQVHGRRCSLCKGAGWIEILGAGMVDPNVFGFVEGYDSAQGFAFGMGIERIAMLKHGVPDLRLFFEGDVRFVEQFR